MSVSEVLAVKVSQKAQRTCSKVEFIYCLKTLFELKTKFSSPATVDCNLPAAQPLFNARAAARAGSPITRLPSIWFSNSGRPSAFLSFLFFLSSSLSFLSQLSTVLCKLKPVKSLEIQRMKAVKQTMFNELHS